MNTIILRQSLLLFSLFFSQVFYAQTVLKGTVKDSTSHETLVGVVIMVDTTFAATTDRDGNYSVKLQNGTHKITFSYLTYESKDIQITASGDTLLYGAMMRSTAQGLNIVVVSASMREKKIVEENVSMEVIQGKIIENTGVRTVDEAMNNVPGVNVTDGQANIRGGSGWAYGAGSRVLMLVDGMPELTPDASNVIWDFLPIEDIQQVEVIKGASSVLYGSSALDGVINVITATPTSKPATSITFHEGIYDNPNVPDSVPWKGMQQPRFDGFSFMHSQRFRQFDWVCSGNLVNEQSYLQGSYDQRARLTTNMRYRFTCIEGLTVGIRASYMYQNTGTYLVWANDTSGILRPFGGTSGQNSTLVDGIFKRAVADPYITYYSKSIGKFTLQGRYFLSDNVDYGSSKGSNAQLYYYEFRYQKEFIYHFTLTAGLSATTNIVNAQLYGKHSGINHAAYIQLEKKFGNLSLTAGVRYETNKVDTFAGNSPIVYRAGANYKLAKATYIRASYGEGYRFPSVAEQFISTSIGPVQIFPNPKIQPETGYSTEIGLNQGLKLGNWQGSADIAFFYTTYNNLIDFSFGYWPPPGGPNWFEYLGFKSVNVENAQISGGEFSFTGEGKIFGLPAHIIAGFTAIEPINLGTRDSVNKYENIHPNLTLIQKDSLAKTEILNYRSLYTAKLGFELSYKKFTFGVNARYNSFVVNIDKIFAGADPNFPNFEIIPGIKHFRKTHPHGDYIIDMHLAFQASSTVKVSFFVKNLFNRTYINRPGLLEPPRNFTLQVGIKF